MPLAFERHADQLEHGRAVVDHQDGALGVAARGRRLGARGLLDQRARGVEPPRQLGDRLLVGWREDQRAIRAVGYSEHQRAVVGVAPALLPGGSSLNHRRAELLRIDPRELLVHDRFDSPRDAHTQGQQRVAAGQQRAGQPGAQHQLVRHILGLGRHIAQGSAK